MKRTLLLTICFLGIFFSAHAQFGIKAGGNVAVLDGDIGKNTDYKFYYHAGLLYDYKLFGPVSLQPELIYSLQGTEYKTVTENYDTKLHYLLLPVLAKVKLGPVRVLAGPQFGLLMTAREAGTMLVSPPGTTPQYDNASRQATDQYNKGDFSVCGGIELKLFDGLMLGTRMNAGISDINEVKNITGVNDPKLRNRVFQAYLSLEFGGSDSRK
ncbi:PorT family protein [Hymenobacter sp. BT175]|uniref:porin family protein n=1 Tax=Hymenobacter translucens TaxID=2886507 RepID=UPI001D0E766A|nr:porin family protein [Hymenobacter translucens]MCC2545962.1 PorT family protein [Hymenobacter translucens]